MVAAPALTPVTSPVVFTVAIDPALLLQVPPAGDALSVMTVVAQTLAGPVIEAGDRSTLIVSVMEQPAGSV